MPAYSWSVFRPVTAAPVGLGGSSGGATDRCAVCDGSGRPVPDTRCRAGRRKKHRGPARATVFIRQVTAPQGLSEGLQVTGVSRQPRLPGRTRALGGPAEGEAHTVCVIRPCGAVSDVSLAQSRQSHGDGASGVAAEDLVGDEA